MKRNGNIPKWAKPNSLIAQSPELQQVYAEVMQAVRSLVPKGRRNPRPYACNSLRRRRRRARMRLLRNAP